MSKYYQTIFILLSIVLLTFSSAFGQFELVVEPGFGTLQDAIAADTTATGERLDPDRVYVLKRDGLYLLNGSVENRFHLRIKAEEGSGARPVLRPGVQTGGGSSRAFRIRDDFTIQGCYITNLDELGGLNDRILRISADDARIEIDDCHLDYASQSALRLDNDWNIVIIKNSTISNIGRMDSPDNGRGVDDRGNPIDTLIFENNTFYNITSRILRDGGGVIKYARINQNTIVDIAQRGCSIGEVVEAEYTNNLVINNGFLGRDTASARSVLEISPLLDSALVANGAVQSLIISNNNFYIDPALIAAQPTDSVENVTLYDSTTAALVSTFSTGTDQIEEGVVFTSGPTVPTTVITDRWDSSILPENRTEMDDGSPAVFGSMPFDFTYSNTAMSYTAAENSFPLGDLNWFPDKKTEWEGFVPPEPLINVDGEKDIFFDGLTGPGDGYLQIQSFAFNDNGAPDDNADHSAHLWAAWDETWFYLYEEVTDDVVNGEAANPWETDCIELKIDGMPDTPGQNISLETRLSALATGNSDDLNNFDAADKKFFRKTTDDGYVLELAIKLSVLGGSEAIAAEVGGKFGLGIALHDNDDGSRNSSIQWSAVMLDAIWNTADYLGTLELLADNKVNFIPTNNMTGVTNDIPYDGSVVGIEDVNSLPTTYAMKQNYPNPFNPSTSIQFQLPKTGNVDIRVYNMLGQLVKTVVNEEIEAGYYNVTFDASNLSSGTYFYSIKAGSFVQTKKMMLLK